MDRPRKFTTMKLLDADKKLLQQLGKGRIDIEDRYHALLELVPIVQQLTLPTKASERKAFRLGIPLELDKALRTQAEKSGQPLVDILLQAARIYRTKHPLKKGK